MSNKPEQSTINACRQILMNELGFTRESIREEMKLIVRDVVEKHVSQLKLDDVLRDAIYSAMQKETKSGTWTTGITERVKAEVEKQVGRHMRELVENSVDISIKLKAKS